jgi:DNA repair protein RecO
MHRVFVTEAVVLGKRGVGEANTLLALLTEELGLIKASAKSTRVEHSKLRYGLETLSVARYSLVRGKHEWKLIGSERVSRELVSKSLKPRRASGRIAKLLLRLIHGEEVMPGMYEVVTEGLSSIAGAHTDEESEYIECIVVLRILSKLGYLPELPELAAFTENTSISPQLTEQAREMKPFLIRTINESLGATGL